MSHKSRINEINFNNFNNHMRIIGYRNYNDIDVYFEKYNWTARHRTYGEFKRGGIKCPYELRLCDVAYLGEGVYKTRDGNKKTKEYVEWNAMVQRCYNPYRINRDLTYKDCIVDDYFLCFQNYAKWREQNYYEIPNEIMSLDKDILYKGNKIYSPNTCIFVPSRINSLLIKADGIRGDLPIGVSYHKGHNKYSARCRIINGNKKQSKFLGYYSNPQEAFYSYKTFKENYIKQVADEYKTLIPSQLYEALYRWEVDIDD